MAVLPILSIAAYSAAVVGHHPNIDGPEPVEKYHGFLRIAAVVLLLFGFVVAIVSFNPESLLVAVVAVFVVGMLAVYDYMIVAKKARKSAKKSVAKASKGAKQNVAKAGKEYLDAKKEMEKGPDQVTNVHGDAVAQKTKQTHVDQSTTNVDTIDQSTTSIDQSKTVKDQRTHVEDSVVNRSDIAAGDGAETGQQAGHGQQPSHGQQPGHGQQPDHGQQPEPEPAGVDNRQSTPRRNPENHQPTHQQSSNPHTPEGRNPNTRQPSQGQTPNGGQRNAANGGVESTGDSGNAGNASYCPSCGEEITPGWSNCISCGADLQ